MKLGNFHLNKKLVPDLPHGRTWLFHGNVFDGTMRHSRWLAKLGGQGCDLLLLLNRFVNFLLDKLGWPRVALSNLVKERVKTAVATIINFEQTAADIAAYEGYRYVARGHIHQPRIKDIATAKAPSPTSIPATGSKTQRPWSTPPKPAGSSTTTTRTRT